MAAARLDHHPSQLLDRSRPLSFRFDGRTVAAYAGDTVASALYASGTRIFSRSFKYHRPRGLLCASGACPNCLMTVDGIPNVRSCTTPVAEGMSVRHQNAWPGLQRDALSVLDKLSWMMPVGFYYKAFHRPSFLWGLVRPIVRRISGLGVLDPRADEPARYSHESIHTDIAVVGGGPAGLSAALAAAGSGLRVTLVDDQPATGGHLRFDTLRHFDLPDIDPGQGFEIAGALSRQVEDAEGIRVLPGATAFGLYEGNLLGVLQGDRMLMIRAGQVVVATGVYESPIGFQSNDLPGIMLATAALRLASLHGVAAGKSAVVVAADGDGYATAFQLLEAGVGVAALVDPRPAPLERELAITDVLESRGVEILRSHRVTQAEGRRAVTAVLAVKVDGGRATGDVRRIECDLVCMAGGFHPAGELLEQAGGWPAAPEGSRAADLPTGLHAAGRVAGAPTLAESVIQGRLAGLEAAASAGRGRGAAPTGSSRSDIEPSTSESDAPASPAREVSRYLWSQGNKAFACFCEDVSSIDVVTAIDEGYDDIQMLKRYTTATMGPCQGRMCRRALVSIAADHTGRTVEETGTTTARPPVQPVPLAALAGEDHHPVKRTAMDRRHLATGGRMVDLGPWQRPHSYGDPADEYVAVRERAGIIDVSTLGKIIVEGRDAGALLDRVYTGRFSDLQVGRVRYGVACSDAGIIMDDGTITRLADGRYFVTTTTGNAEAMEEWLKWWSAGAASCVHVTSVTSGLAAVNIAGPRAREILAALTEADLSAGAFPYMRSAEANVAGVPATLLRIGFVGETGWELHFPAEYGEHVWDALLEAGDEFGIAPFGLEAQRILRLEKKHPIVGQDTDSTSTPLDSGMGWAVRFDKDDFIGKAGLLAARDQGSDSLLVGFSMQNGVIPDDGNPVIEGTQPVGRVTSARFSPSADKAIGLARVPADLTSEGADITILVDGRPEPAEVTLKPAYDPDGLRLRG